jgi:hypothetical protein
MPTASAKRWSAITVVKVEKVEDRSRASPADDAV